MLPACRTASEGYAIPTFDIVPSDVEGFMEELWAFQSAFHDCFARGEPRAHFFDYLVGQLSKLERKSIEPMALHVEGGTIRGMQRFISDVRWDEEQRQWTYHQLVADELGEPEGVLMFDETGFVKKGKNSVGVARQYCGTLLSVAPEAALGKKSAGPDRVAAPHVVRGDSALTHVHGGGCPRTCGVGTAVQSPGVSVT